MSKLIHTYLTVIEAQLLATEMRDVGIPCEVLDVHSNYTNRESAFTEGVRLAVPDDLYEEATRFIQNRRGPNQSSDYGVQCPYCQSRDIVLRYSFRTMLRVLVALLVGAIFPVVMQKKKDYACRGCGQRFTN
ncbi:MAG: hypothetical protein H6608_07650 [Flavobacteriales bacterium]|nr:hypothetical protein [Bacteroidota bacterium]MCB9240989.1 hypothetical protein [Flavobacteriales bacterium]